MHAVTETPDAPTGTLGKGAALSGATASATPALLFGLRLSASVSLALLIAFWLQLPSPYWAATSAGIVAQPALGASLRKGRFRAIGTAFGGTLIVFLIAAFPQDHAGFLVSLVFWSAVCGFFATVLPHFAGYAAALAGYTVAIVFAGITQRPENVFLVAVWRTTEIGIGIFSAGLVHSLTDFGDARRRLAREMTQIAKGIAAGLGESLRTGVETTELRTTRRALIGRTAGLDAVVDEAIGEPSDVRHQRGRLLAGTEALFVALSGWRGIGNHLAMSRSPPKAGARCALLQPLAELAHGDWLANAEEMRALCEKEGRAAQDGAAGELASRLISEEVGRVFRALEVVADTLLAVTRAGARPRAGVRRPLSVPDLLPAALNALRIVLALAAAAAIWIATSWPGGPIMVTFTAVNVILSARLAEGPYSRAVEFALGCHVAAALAVVMDLAILPRLHGGPLELSLALTMVLLPLGVLAAGSWRKSVFVAAVGNVMPILALENVPSYNAAHLFDTVLAVSAGTVIAAVFFRLIPPLSPQRRTERLLRFTLQDLRALIGGRRRFTASAWLDRVAARLAAMPEQAGLEEVAELLATLSVGEAALALLAAHSNDATRLRKWLDCAFVPLAAGRVAASHDAFVRLAASPIEVPPAGNCAVDVSVQATLIADALQRHGRFFSEAA